MGRRPNAVISEYFARGIKLEDASNRYSHTCKRCGEFFPKGRIDSLISHLLRRCPHLTDQDRQYVFQATQQQSSVLRQVAPVGVQLPPTSQRSIRFSDPVQSPEEAKLNTGDLLTMHQHLTSSIVSQLTNREQSALDTLAEVSRRHLDLSSLHGHDGNAVEPGIDPGRQLAEQALLMQLQQTTGLGSSRAAAEATGSNTRYQPDPPRDLSAVSQSRKESDSASRGDRSSSSQLEPKGSPKLSEMDIDPDLHPVNSDSSHAHPMFTIQAHEESLQLLWTPPTIAPGQGWPKEDVHQPLAESASGFGLPQQGSKVNVRARFNDNRRKEVQEIRKKGACIRCRMLKKPCSEGTPCSTCRSVETARLWKSACIRTKLSDVFTLWTTGLFFTRCKIEIPSALRGLQRNDTTAHIELRHKSASSPGMNLTASKYASTSMPVQSALDLSDHQAHVEGDVWILLDEETLPRKLGEFAKLLSSTFVPSHVSPFSRATIRRAQTSMAALEVDAVTLTAQPPRSCLQDHLLSNVVELWNLTCILVNEEAIAIRLHLNPTSQDSTHKDGENDMPISNHSRGLIRVQLLSAIESRCTSLSRTVTNELERRLLQRQQVSRFDTFLSATILLTCVEQMTGLFRMMDTDSDVANTDTTKDQEMVRRLRGWPLDQQPRQLWPQGEHFAELLIMLLRMRALSPPTQVLSSGRLAVDYSQSSDGRQTSKQDVQEQMNMAAAWLDPMELNPEELIRIRDREVPKPEDGVEAWDMRFVSRILLPAQKESGS